MDPDDGPLSELGGEEESCWCVGRRFDSQPPSRLGMADKEMSWIRVDDPAT